MIRKGDKPRFQVRIPASMKFFIKKVCKIEGISYPNFVREAVVEKLMKVTKLTREQAAMLGWAHIGDIYVELSGDVKEDALSLLLKNHSFTSEVNGGYDEETLMAMSRGRLYRVAKKLKVKTPKTLTKKNRKRLVKKILKAQSEE